MVISYLSLALFIPYLFVEETHPVAALSGLVDFICSVTLIVWGFKARNRMNVILSNSKTDNEWFHGFWTFLFTPLYFNFKVNKLDKSRTSLGASFLPEESLPQPPRAKAL